MAILDKILQEFSHLSDAQKEAVAQTDGPLLIIAGPGSGKTLVLVVRALNILLQGLAEPREVMLCTFTEKAAFEIRNRLSFPYRLEVVEAAGIHFDAVVAQILAKNFALTRPPETKVCKECDFRLYCGREGIIKIKEISL